MHISKFKITRIAFFAAFLLAVVASTPAYAATKSEDVAAKEKEIAELDKKIKELASEHGQASNETQQQAAEVRKLRQQLEAARLELKRTQLTIEQVQVEQEQAGDAIGTLQDSIEQHRARLGGLVRVLYEEDQQSIIRLFFDSLSLGQVLQHRAVIDGLRQEVTETTRSMHGQIQALTAEEAKLQEREQNLSQLQAVLATQEEEVAQQEKTEAQTLEERKAEEAQVASQLAEAKQAREEIAKHVFSLKSSNIEVTLTNAFDMARYASSVTNVRPALLLAVLKVESNLGNNVGGGRYPDDMQPASREAFVRITDKLGLDRKTTPVARKPANGRGWGGAMGPAQIMPATWETIEPRLEQLTKRSPVSPYELPDAFVATAIFLADRGAAAGNERQALAKYVAGPYWEYHVNGWYVERVLAVAVEYENELAR